MNRPASSTPTWERGSAGSETGCLGRCSAPPPPLTPPRPPSSPLPSPSHPHDHHSGWSKPLQPNQRGWHWWWGGQSWNGRWWGFNHVKRGGSIGCWVEKWGREGFNWISYEGWMGWNVLMMSGEDHYSLMCRWWYMFCGNLHPYTSD